MDKNIKVNAFLHGGDYNPEQWLDYPELLEKDLLYLKEAACNVVTLGVFSWAILEPQEGCYNFEWLEEIVNRLSNNGIYVMLATPSGARPKWLSDKYPEVLRVDEKRVRQLFGRRHNHCYTSPVFREKIALINHELGKRFANHEAVIGWHISNEFGGECHCPLCQDAFRNWLRKRYQSIDELNKKWYTSFWSHTYQTFEQIESPSSIGEDGLHGLNLDWKRFVTDQTLNYMLHEVNILRPYNQEIPVTTNFMYYFDDLNYFKFKDSVDFISWDSYPTWHKHSDDEIAIDNSMWHDMMRSIKKKPFILMESSPSYTNWQGVSKPKKPGMHELSSLQSIAHGSDSVMYFQWRQSRGASEKFHGAVIQHDGRNDTRVFNEVRNLGETLQQLEQIKGTVNKSEVAIIYDWENKWAIENSQGPRNKGMYYKETVQKSYRAFRKMGLNIDFVDMETKFVGYKVLVAPMLYMFRGNIQQKIREFVSNGGTVIMTYWSGVVDENDCCFLGANPNDLVDVFGVSREEFIGLYDWEENTTTSGYKCQHLCEVLTLEGALPLMHYTKDYYKNTPAVTLNRYHKGEAYYIAADMEQRFYDDFYKKMIKDLSLYTPINNTTELPEGIQVTSRTSSENEYVFVQNFSEESKHFQVKDDLKLIFGDDNNTIKPYGTHIYKR